MDEAKKQHLEFIQNVITRMNTNSFQIKGMAITIVTALLAIYASTTNEVFVFISIIPTLLFWFLDSYYLQQERKFRGIYNNVCGLKNDIEIKLYEMPIQKFQGGQYCFCKVFFSKTIAWLYGTIIALLFVSGLILKFKACVITNCL
jgi:cytochrome b subunit of formate dehydrogenase